MNPAPGELPGTLALVSRGLREADGRGTKGSQTMPPPHSHSRRHLKKKKKEMCRHDATGASLSRLFCSMTSRWQRKTKSEKKGRRVVLHGCFVWINLPGPMILCRIHLFTHPKNKLTEKMKIFPARFFF